MPALHDTGWELVTIRRLLHPDRAYRPQVEPLHEWRPVVPGVRATVRKVRVAVGSDLQGLTFELGLFCGVAIGLVLWAIARLAGV